MKNKQKTSPSRHKRIITILSSSVVILLAITLGYWIFNLNKASEVYPLGGKLDFVGQRDYGCWGLCGSPPSTTYSYATDLKPDELAAYFKSAKMNDPSQIENWQNSADHFWINFTSQSNKTFTLYFYMDGQDRIRLFKFQPSNKKYVIEIDKKAYAAAKESL